MNASLYVQILQNTLLPSLQRDYPGDHRFMQDNNPKHTSSSAWTFFKNNGINWWRTSPESPDANPIENLWYELKVGTRPIVCLMLEIPWHVYNYRYRHSLI